MTDEYVFFKDIANIQALYGIKNMKTKRSVDTEIDQRDDEYVNSNLISTMQRID